MVPAQETEEGFQNNNVNYVLPASVSNCLVFKEDGLGALQRREGELIVRYCCACVSSAHSFMHVLFTKYIDVK